MKTPRENPFRHMGQWYWLDENEQTHGPYKTQRDSLRGLLLHYDPSIIYEGSLINRLIIEVPLVVMLALGIDMLVRWMAS